MKPTIVTTTICALVLIAFLLCAGCSILSEGDSGTTTSSATPVVTTQATTAKVTTPATTRITTRVTAAPESTVVAGETTDPWANFVEPTETEEEQVTEEPTVEETEPEEEVVTEEPTAEAEEIETEIPTTEPTIPYVADTCGNIGGNICSSDEVCSGAFIKTTDEAQCCAGICEPK
jgi:hypothetical protein